MKKRAFLDFVLHRADEKIGAESQPTPNWQRLKLPPRSAGLLWAWQLVIATKRSSPGGDQPGYPAQPPLGSPMHASTSR